MPRRTIKTKAKNENVAFKKALKEKCIKKEELNSPNQNVVEEVVHRKSERRRVARDIFLVFEKETNSKKKSGSNKKQTKPKFGHLKVEDPLRPKGGLLRDIKNEPKCFLKVRNATIPLDARILKEEPKILGKEGKPVKKEKSISTKKLRSIKSITTLEPETCSFDDTKSVAKVNPIFLWVKQDGTRIVEVRCEDYDRRNRIRLTKTTNGWRSIPRSDPSTSRVLKFNPTPLMKVKKENTSHETSNSFNSSSTCQSKNTLFCEEFSIPTLLTNSGANGINSKVIRNIDTVCNPLAIKKEKTKSRKAKKSKKKSFLDKSNKFEIITAECKTVSPSETNATHLINPPFTTKSSEVFDFQLQTGTELEPCQNQMPENCLDIKNLAERESESVDLLNGNAQVLESSSPSTCPSLTIDTPLETKSIYHKLEEGEDSFHLCPKTGLFLSEKNSGSGDDNESFDNILECDKNCYFISNKDEFNVDIEKSCIEAKIQVTEENIDSLEAKTKNLKDLLDEADLFQNCGDNTNSDADLIDNLVKTSCENNLILANELIKSNTVQYQPKSVQESNELVVQLIADVREPPKCLSFNEAGEIEDLSDELFESNTFMESFEKHSGNMPDTQAILDSTSNALETSIPPNKISLSEGLKTVLENTDTNISKVQPVSTIEESPKDLSYKKREEVCPQSESRSQCVVTSSSDVINSPEFKDITPMVSPSETLKNIILEQFIKLNALTSNHQRETVDSDKQGYLNMCCSKPEQSNNIETVVIDDDDDDNDSDNDILEPIKKRLRLQKHKVISQNKLIIDKDPDPLTQLRLLIKNTRWKVPDPILVPKDRLSAVLASPAREIPLLITTRPELRLPEAFAYPEIIQNPNILVISMAQLEAILKNEIEKDTSIKPMKSDANQKLGENHLHKRLIDLPLPPPEKHHQHSATKHALNLTPNNPMDIAESVCMSQKYDKILPTDSSSSEINSAAMTVLNQMFWLPYFNHISQEIGKYIKNPKELQEHFLNSASWLNGQFKGKTEKPDKQAENSVLNASLQSFLQQPLNTNEELSLFQKMVHNQMQSVLQLNQLPGDSRKLSTSAKPDNSASLVEKSKSKTESPSSLIEQRKTHCLSNKKQASTSLCENQDNNVCHNIALPQISYNLRSSAAGHHSVETKQYSTNNQRHISDNKPKLTCKSLSNLLDPEHSMTPSTSLRQDITGFLNSDNYKRNSIDNKLVGINAERNGKFSSANTIEIQSQKSYGNMVANMVSSTEVQKEKSKLNLENSSSNDAGVLAADSNVPLWHPLFGSNTKTAYSSPWQWTTVTATSE